MDGTAQQHAQAPGAEVPRSAQAPRCASPRAIFERCPLCDSSLYAEHAHFRCGSCGWRDSCCD